MLTRKEAQEALIRLGLACAMILVGWGFIVMVKAI